MIIIIAFTIRISTVITNMVAIDTDFSITFIFTCTYTFTFIFASIFSYTIVVVVLVLVDTDIAPAKTIGSNMNNAHMTL